MTWLKQLFAAILDWLTNLVERDTKAGNADKTPDKLKNAWRERILETERKANEDSKDNSTD